MVDKKKAVEELKKGLEKFKADAVKKGWEEDEVKEKITEVYENFPWYKYNPPKKSKKSKFLNIILFLFITYLAATAYLERNRRLKKRVNDYFFDLHISYHAQRVLRIMTLPVFSLYDLSVYHDADCLIYNPFKTPEELDCTFCEGIESIPQLSITSRDIPDMIKESEPLVVTDVPSYAEKNVTFDDFKKMFQNHREELDEATCDLNLNNKYTKISDFFKDLDEKTVVENEISIEWSNCHTYGTRFYRKIFPRPEFVAKESEIHFEKRVFFLQKGVNTTLTRSEGKNYYIYQVQGSSNFQMLAPSSCFHNCTNEPLDVSISKGHIAIFPNSGWDITFQAMSDGLNIAFLSSFT